MYPNIISHYASICAPLVRSRPASFRAGVEPIFLARSPLFCLGNAWNGSRTDKGNVAVEKGYM